MFSAAVPSPAFSSFKARAEAVSAEVHHFPTRAEALAFILQFLRDEGGADNPGCYAVWADSTPAKSALAGAPRPFLDGLMKSELAASLAG